ncbi:hypothetical protein MHK_002073 [Candidatus Magnetomorum sp. HK-1]|nr:hypothetical protein MHK_002073 [Candidatus Magnetomorum sp. HK-1]
MADTWPKLAEQKLSLGDTTIQHFVRFDGKPMGQIYEDDLDDSEFELAPQNPNPRGAHGTDAERDILDEIIRRLSRHFLTQCCV